MLAPFGPCTERSALASRFADKAHDTATSDLSTLLASWRRHLVAQRMSPATLSTYSTSVRQLARFLAERGMPTSAAALTREHVEADDGTGKVKLTKLSETGTGFGGEEFRPCSPG